MHGGHSYRIGPALGFRGSGHVIVGLYRDENDLRPVERIFCVGAGADVTAPAKRGPSLVGYFSAITRTR